MYCYKFIYQGVVLETVNCYEELTRIDINNYKNRIAQDNGIEAFKITCRRAF